MNLNENKFILSSKQAVEGSNPSAITSINTGPPRDWGLFLLDGIPSLRTLYAQFFIIAAISNRNSEKIDCNFELYDVFWIAVVAVKNRCYIMHSHRSEVLVLVLGL